jgi:hypothetical protein
MIRALPNTVFVDEADFRMAERADHNRINLLGTEFLI